MSDEPPADSQGKIVVFGANQIRRTFKDGEWFFSVVDIVAALTDSDNPRDYWYRMKQREKESSGIELSTFCRQLPAFGGADIPVCPNRRAGVLLPPKPIRSRRRSFQGDGGE